MDSRPDGREEQVRAPHFERPSGGVLQVVVSGDACVFHFGVSWKELWSLVAPVWGPGLEKPTSRRKSDVLTLTSLRTHRRGVSWDPYNDSGESECKASTPIRLTAITVLSRFGNMLLPARAGQVSAAAYSLILMDTGSLTTARESRLTKSGIAGMPLMATTEILALAAIATQAA